MKKDSNELIRDAEADGIQEYDNDMPRWWIQLFYLTIVLGLAYGIYKHGMGGETLIEAFNADKAAHESLIASLSTAVPAQQPDGKAPEQAPVDLKAKFENPAVIAQGKETYSANCAACHGPDGGGGIGPNLTDKYFLHGARPEDLVAVITKGVPEKGMMGWTPILGAQKVEDVAAYVYSLIGTTPQNPKAPQGELLP